MNRLPNRAESAPWRRAVRGMGAALLTALCAVSTVHSQGAHVGATPASGGSIPTRISPEVACCSGGGGGATTATTYFEQGELVRSGEVVQALGPNLMGDNINTFTGSVEFSQTDVTLPGNNGLPVAIGRRLALGSLSPKAAGGLFGDWDLEIPHLHTLSSGNGYNPFNWYGLSGDTTTTNRCSQFAPPQWGIGASGATVTPVPGWKWWDGYHMYVPGAGDQAMEGRSTTNTLAPSTGSYPVVTKAGWQFSCLSTLASGGSGEGFNALAPDGTSYRFDRMVMRAYPTQAPPPTDSGPSLHISREEIWILPSQITDRFGNWVKYAYDTTDGWKINSITSSDGRSISLTYYAGTHRVYQVTDGTRTWTYNYAPTTNLLQSIVQPDSSTWQFSLSTLEVDPFYLQDPGCPPTDQPNTIDTSIHTGTITHPSGATATFNTQFTWHGRTNVRGSVSQCNLAASTNYVSTYFATMALKSKVLSGPGMPQMTWSYDYGTASGCFAPCTGGVLTKTVTITDPLTNVTKNTYGTQMYVNDGLLLESDEGWTASGALRKAVSTYRAPGAGPYPNAVGYNGNTYSDSMSNIFTPEDSHTITQQGVTFARTVTAFDSQARATASTAASSLGYSRNQATIYSDNTLLWVLGQVASQSINGSVVSSTTYFPTALPSATYSFGKLKANYVFNANGTLYSVADGLGQTTTYSNYMRGLAQNIGYADGSTISAVVNNIGAITSVTNEASTTTSYTYDPMGRLASETYPNDAGLTYLPKNLSFVQVGSVEFGIPAGHWKQTITTGNAVTVNYFDARWRKLLTQTYDSSNQSGTLSQQLFTYDPYNRTTYASYPTNTITSIGSSTSGTNTTYDALGRVTQTQSASELGTLTAHRNYLSNFQTQSIDARGNSTTTSYQTFDEPSEDAITAIAAPEGVNVSIARDVFGKTTSITRSGAYAGSTLSATRSYVYDGNQLLCKTIDPETGATLELLDAANNVSWRAPGQALTSATCDVASVPAAGKISYAYDKRNRLLNTTFGDNSAAISRTYTADGLLQTVASDNSTWSMAYNNRRLMTTHGVVLSGVNYGLGWGYDAYGHRNATTYPDGGTITDALDALGRPNKVGLTQRGGAGYASGITYFPNGIVSGYTDGNGIVHTATLNTRGLIATLSDSGVFNDQYSYDENGNVTAIVDQQLGVSTRNMTYDGLDRLKATSAQNLWGSATYTYDPLDNLRTSVVGSRSSTHNYDASNRLSSIVTNGVTTAYGYDARGNVTTLGAETFNFDLGNRLRLASGIASYTYDGFGRRTSIGQSSTTTNQVYDIDGKFLYRTSTGPSTGTSDLYLGDKLLDESVVNVSNSWVHTDNLGSPIAITSEPGAILSRTYYEPYGRTASGTVPTAVGFTGQVNDASTGLVYMQQRYYDPIAGRFLSLDPVVTDEQTGKAFNRYDYVNANPYRYTDPNGESPDPWGSQTIYQAADSAYGQQQAQASPQRAADLAKLAGAAAKVADITSNAAMLLPGEAEIVGGVKLGEAIVKNFAGKGMATVGRWMSREELALMQSTGRVVEGAGGSTYVATSGAQSFMKQAQPGSVYVEFGVPKTSLLQGGQADWFKMIGPSAPRSMQFMLQKQGGEMLPKVQNLSDVLVTK